MLITEMLPSYEKYSRITLRVHMAESTFYVLFSIRIVSSSVVREVNSVQATYIS